MPLPRDASCACCGEKTREFLFMPDSRGTIYCGNCRKARMFGMPCPHQFRSPALPAVVVARIDRLRAPEGHSVTFLCPNPCPELNGEEDEVIEVVGDWTGWETRRFGGPTVAEALQAACAALDAAAFLPAPATDNPAPDGITTESEPCS